jgi:hypothetical protein
MMAEFTQMAFDPEDGLNNKTAYPTTPGSESAARAQIQHPLDELKNALNGLMSELENIESGHSGAEKIGSAPIDGVTGDTVWAQMAYMNSQILAAWEGVLTNGVINDTEMFADDVVTGAKIADDAIDSEHIADGAVGAAHLGAGCVTGESIADDAVDSAHIADGAVDAAHISSGAVTETKLSAGAVTVTKIADSAVTAAKVASSAVTGSKIADGAVTASKIASSAVTNAKIANGAVNAAKLDASLGDRIRKITISSSSPSGGSNGDIWIKY